VGLAGVLQKTNMPSRFQVGDLVTFDFSHALGIVLAIKEAEEFTEYENDIYDVWICWSDGEIFWCLDFTLQHVSPSLN
jgi:hypothetical protein